MPKKTKTTKATKKTSKKPATKKRSGASFLKCAMTAKHFGFEVGNKISVSNSTTKTCAGLKKEKKFFDEYFPTMEEAAELLIEYKDSEKNGAPVFKYFDSPASGNHTKQRKRPGEEQVSLHVMGVDTSIADALVIKTAETMLRESGYKDLTLMINNVGGKESQTQFNREATAFFRKHISILNATCRQYFKEGVHTLMTEGGEDCRVLKEHAPATLDFLSEETRNKFKELIEFIEASEINYEINGDVLGDINYSTHTTFKIIEDSTGKVLAAGTRYNLLAKKLGSRKEIPAMSANVWVKSNKTPKNVTDKKLEKMNDNKFFLIQVGNTAKMLSLKILESLHNAGITINHRIVRDKLSSQLQLSNKLQPEYIMIVGHKEALEKSAIVKDFQGKKQKIVPFDELVTYLKSL